MGQDFLDLLYSTCSTNLVADVRAQIRPEHGLMRVVLAGTLTQIKIMYRNKMSIEAK